MCSLPSVVGGRLPGSDGGEGAALLELHLRAAAAGVSGRRRGGLRLLPLGRPPGAAGKFLKSEEPLNFIQSGHRVH